LAGFSAKLDTITNYIPARITALLMIVSAYLLHENWKNGWRILIRDRNRTESLNAGWSMSIMAGALSCQLEKPGFYALGDDDYELSSEHITRALHIMKLTTFLFSFLIVVPIFILLQHV
jgi:Cobalamin biosynthesis protein CobD/CbiB